MYEAWSGPPQKCTEYWPEEQVVYDGVEIIVQKVIHTEDYRLRVISLRVRPGAGPGGWGDRAQITGPRSALRVKSRPVSLSGCSREEGGGVDDLGARGRSKPQLHFMLSESPCVCTVLVNAFQVCSRCIHVGDCLGKGSPAAPPPPPRPLLS